MKPKLTYEHYKALEQFAQANGRTWKSKLNDAWMTGRYRDYYLCAPDIVLLQALLQQVRNNFGPSWLVRFQFRDYVYSHPLAKDLYDGTEAH